MSTLPKFRAAVGVAMTLPTPRRLLLTILASTDATHDGLRAAGYEARVRSSRGASTTERLAENRVLGRQLTDHEKARLNKRERDDIADTVRHAEAWMVAVATLLAEALDAGCPDMDDYEWEDAVKDAHLILECEGGERLRAAIDVERNVGGPMRSATRAIKGLQAIHHRYNPHAAGPWTRYRQAGGRIDEICEIHASLDPPVFKPKHGREQLCKTCADLTRTAGERPPVALIELLERGGQVAYRNARSRWLESLGVAAAS